MNVSLELIKIYRVVTTRHRTGVLRLWKGISSICVAACYTNKKFRKKDIYNCATACRTIAKGTKNLDEFKPLIFFTLQA